ncbi:MAG: hypothetical protein R3E91_01620 [Chlamydiales bacterium]
MLFFYFVSALPIEAIPNLGSANLFNKEQNLVINNRVLVKIHGQPITVMDVVRKMDLIFYRQFPEIAASPNICYQFYVNSWEKVLEAVIDDYLIFADAEEKKVEISEGEVREELENLFGPDVVFNLDKIGLTLNEGIDMLKRELTVQRMNMMMVRSRAFAQAHPQEIRARYDQMLKDNPPQDKWIYQTLSIRGEGHKQVAEEVWNLLDKQKMTFHEAIANLVDSPCQITLSNDYEVEEKSISNSHKSILQTLAIGAYSFPQNKDGVSRIFCLKEYEKGNPVLFNAVADKIKGELIRELSAKYEEEYRLKLRKQYGITERYIKETIPENFFPFALK